MWRIRLKSYLKVGLLSGCLVCRGSAHNGPPIRVLTDQKVGTCLVSVWTHANEGTTPFWIRVSPSAGGQIPKDLSVEIAARPLNSDVSEKFYASYIDGQESSATLQFRSDVTLDAIGPWRIRVLLKGRTENGDIAIVVQATDHGFGKWDLLLYALPFLAIGALWLGALARRKRLAPTHATPGI